MQGNSTTLVDNTEDPAAPIINELVNVAVAAPEQPTSIPPVPGTGSSYEPNILVLDCAEKRSAKPTIAAPKEGCEQPARQCRNGKSMVDAAKDNAPEVETVYKEFGETYPLHFSTHSIPPKRLNSQDTNATAKRFLALWEVIRLSLQKHIFQPRTITAEDEDNALTQSFDENALEANHFPLRGGMTILLHSTTKNGVGEVLPRQGFTVGLQVFVDRGWLCLVVHGGDLGFSNGGDELTTSL
ncbi:hypothetical protein VNO78_08254 [Psophocarpus tetragonolobus]|uniref:Uncharacterized protein n=1 Tax=Psophocarpus tetragonolobus TaxID=3891 RepID=A0AAN9SXK5_PSOTE